MWISCVLCQKISGRFSCITCLSGKYRFTSNNDGVYNLCISSEFLDSPSPDNIVNTIQRGFYSSSTTAQVSAGEGVALRCTSPCITCELIDSRQSCKTCPANQLRLSSDASTIYDLCLELKYLTEGKTDNGDRGFYTEDSITSKALGTVIAKKCPSPCKLCSFVDNSITCDSCFPNSLKFSSTKLSV